jgi:hypothetical protein
MISLDETTSSRAADKLGSSISISIVTVLDHNRDSCPSMCCWDATPIVQVNAAVDLSTHSVTHESVFSPPVSVMIPFLPFCSRKLAQASIASVPLGVHEFVTVVLRYD